MADILRIVSRPDRGRRRSVVLLDIGDNVNYVPTRDSWTYTSPIAQPQLASSYRRFGGQRQVGESHQNAVAQRSIVVRGSSGDNCLQKIESLLQQTEDYPGKFVEWRADGASRSVFMELRGVATWNPKYSWAQFFGAKSVEVDVQFPVAPLAQGDCLDYFDDFTVDSRADYTFDAGTTADVVVDTANGRLSPFSGGTPLANERRARFTGRGHQHYDAQGLITFMVRTDNNLTKTGFKVGRILRAQATTYLEGYLDDDGTNSRLRIDRVVAGVRTNLATTNLASRLIGQNLYQLKVSIEGNFVRAAYTTLGEIGLTPAEVAGPVITQVTATLSTTGTNDAATFAAAGYSGWSWIPQLIDGGYVTAYDDQPFTFRLRSLPEHMRLRGVPGDGPPQMDLSLTPTGGAAAPIAALLGWARSSSAYSPIWNGDFEAGIVGWASSGSAVSTGSTLTWETGAGANHQYGTSSLKVVTTAALTAEGTTFRVYRRFRRGTLYTVSFWLKGTAGNVWRYGIQDSSGADGTSTVTTLAAGWQQVSIQWVPTADRDVADIYVITNAAVIQTVWIDAAAVVEGSAPVSGLTPQGQGKGAVPPVGVIKAESQYEPDRSGWVLTADANYLGGFGLKITTSGVGSALGSNSACR
jgi:hypothetical protein